MTSKPFRAALLASAFATLLANGAAAESSLWGIYGDHSMHDCPLNNLETAELVVNIANSDLGPVLQKYGISAVHDQYHSGLEHTFLWVFETERPHQLEEFAQEIGVAAWNDLKIVPIRRFAEDVVPEVKRLHDLH